VRKYFPVTIIKHNLASINGRHELYSGLLSFKVIKNKLFSNFATKLISIVLDKQRDNR